MFRWERSAFLISNFLLQEYPNNGLAIQRSLQRFLTCFSRCVNHDHAHTLYALRPLNGVDHPFHNDFYDFPDSGNAITIRNEIAHESLTAMTNGPTVPNLPHFSGSPCHSLRGYVFPHLRFTLYYCLLHGYDFPNLYGLLSSLQFSFRDSRLSDIFSFST